MKEALHKSPLGCFGIIRWFIAIGLLLIFTTWVVVGIPLSALSRTVTQRGHIKYWLVASGIYQQPVTLISDVIIHTTPNDSPLRPVAEQAKHSDSVLGQTLTTIIYPTFVQHSVHTIINATYDWLEGKTTRPDFTIALLPDETAATALFNQLPQNSLNNQLPLTVDGIMQQTTVRSSQLPLDDATSQKMQQSFTLLVILPGIIVAVSLILIALLLIIIPDRRRSFMVVGTTLLSLGGILAITELVLAANFTNILQVLFTSGLPPEAGWIQQTFQAPLQLAYNDILTRTARYSLALAATGGMFMLLAMLSQLPFNLFKSKTKVQPKQFHRGK